MLTTSLLASIPFSGLPTKTLSMDITVVGRCTSAAALNAAESFRGIATLAYDSSTSIVRLVAFNIIDAAKDPLLCFDYLYFDASGSTANLYAVSQNGFAMSYNIAMVNLDV